MPLGKLNNAKVPWGIDHSHSEINRLVKQMPGKPIKMCTEAFVNQTGSHACDLDPKASVGIITAASYNHVTKDINYEGDITHDATIAGINNGTIVKKTSPHIVSEFQDEAGMIHMVDFECLTITKNPAFPESVFNVSYIAEETSEEEKEPEEETKPDKPKRSLKFDKVEEPETITITQEDLDKMIDARVAKMYPKEQEPDRTKEVGNEGLTPDQFDQLYEQRRENERKSDALNEYRLISHTLGIEIDADNLKSMNNLDSATIKSMTANLRKIKEKIPEKPQEEEIKPIYYNPKDGTGGFHGTGEMTVGYKDDNGNWVTKV